MDNREPQVQWVGQKRQTHAKSRRGCRNCKRRHIKCDEQGPRCANCQVRGTTCVYAPLPGHVVWQCDALDTVDTARGQEPPVAKSFSLSTPAQLDIDSLSRLPPPRPPPEISPVAFSSTPQLSRLSELELMHRWCTKTWSTVSCVPSEQLSWREDLPHRALTHGYLMNGLLAVAAADAARSGRVEFASMAHRLGQSATSDFQRQLSSSGAVKLLNFGTFGKLCCVFNFSMPETSQTTVARLTQAFDTAAAVTSFALSSIDGHPFCGSEVFQELYTTPTLAVSDPDTQKALDVLTAVSRQVEVPAGEASTLAGAGTVCAYDMPAYRHAIAHVSRSFAEHERGHYSSYWFSIVDIAPQEYFAALKRGEPMALLILLYLSLVVHRSSNNPHLWWVGAAGWEMVSELSERLQETTLASMPDVAQAMSWVNQEVGLA